MFQNSYQWDFLITLGIIEKPKVHGVVGAKDPKLRKSFNAFNQLLKPFENIFRGTPFDPRPVPQKISTSVQPMPHFSIAEFSSKQG